MQKLPGGIWTGQRVEVRGEPWLVVRSERFEDCALVTLSGAGQDNLGSTASVLAPFDQIKPLRHSPRVRRASRHSVMSAAARAAARAHGWREPWTIVRARMELLPWQLEPAVAAVSGATRLLLADEVGLGKTIQAGLIVAELIARGLITRALILTPASLREQWATELRERFALDPQVIDHASLTRLGVSLPPGVNPWTTADLIVSSIDLVKRPEVRAAIDSVPLDLLIVDEAHHLTRGSDRAALVTDLAARSTWVVLATATPHAGDEQAYAFVCGLGALRAEGAPVVFRRRSTDVGRARERRLRFKPVRGTEAERAVLDSVLAYAHALWRADSENKSQGALLATVICRRAASSGRALIRTLLRRRELLSGGPVLPTQPDLPWLETDEADGVEADTLLSAARLGRTDDEVAWLDRLIVLTEALDQTSSKFAAIEQLLARTTEAALVFSEYRDTLSALDDRLSSSFSIATLHGGMSARERGESIERFVSGRARVLLATDAAGEGLNLQERCRLVVNIELPWSPVRLEQRIGRVDRLGQTRRVHALHLYHSDSFEDRVLAALHRRMLQATVAPRDHVAPTSAPLAAVRRTAAALARRASALAPRDATLCAGLSRRSPLAGGAVLLFECDVHDSTGRLTAREVVPIRASFHRPMRLRRRAVCRSAIALAGSPSVQTALDATIAARVQAVAAHTRRTAAAIEERLASISAALERAVPALFQGSLFDRRAEQRARGDAVARATLREHLEHRRRALRSLGEARVSHPRLVAAWFIPIQ